MHKERPVEVEPHYWVMAKLFEPKYEDEWKFLRAERKVVERKLAEKPSAVLRQLSIPGLGILQRRDWQRYGRALDHYEHQLKLYADEVADGVLPVKFLAYNRDNRSDKRVHVRVSVQDGRVDTKKKVPERPERIDGNGKPAAKWKWPKIGRFSRSGISITGHTVTAEFSGLGSHDGAVLVNQLLHIHCGPDTEVTYELRSRNVLHETGDVEI